MNINTIRILCNKIRIISMIICIVTVMMLVLPGRIIAEEKGYLVVKDNETILDPKSNTSIKWQNKIWFTHMNVRVENTQETHRVLLIDMETGKVYQMDTREKTYHTLNFPEGLKNLYSQGELKSMKMDQVKKCGEWDCYGVKLMTQSAEISLETEYWLAEEVDIPFELRKKIATYFGADQVRLTKELSKYEGYPVQTVLKMMVNDKEIRMISNVVEVKKLTLDPEIFKVPADFKYVESMTVKEPEDEKARDANRPDPKKMEDKPLKE